MIPADIQDRDCAANLIRKTRCLFPWIAKLFADGGYAGAKLKAALAGQPVELQIVKRTDNEGGFKVVVDGGSSSEHYLGCDAIDA